MAFGGHFLILLAILAFTSSSPSPPVSVFNNGYKAAVLEHLFVLSDRCKEIEDDHDQAKCVKGENLNIYEEHIVEAAQQGAEIIVFPEQGLHGGRVVPISVVLTYAEDIPEPSSDWTPCDHAQYNETHLAQYHFSCMARRYRMYVVGNCIDHQTERGGVNGTYLYNTAVAYDPTGKLVAKYHKEHLFSFEKLIFNEPIQPEISYFDTPFGRVGIFICFDILFQRPAYELIEKYGIKQIAFPTAWIDELPMWSAVGVHSAFAMTMGVNLLSANYRIPAPGRMMGSGIYSSRGPLAYTRDMTKQTSILVVAWVPNLDFQSTQTFLTYQNPRDTNDTFESYVFHDLHKFKSLDSGSGVKEVCMKNFCCKLKYSATIPADEKFALGVFYGRHTAAQQNLDYQNCLVTKCANLENSSCGQSVINTNARFDHLHLEGNFKAKYVFPTVLLNDVQLPSVGSYKYKLRGDAYVSGEEGFEEPMLMAALHGRIYTDSCDPDD